MTAIETELYKDSKINTILTMLAEGKTKNEITNHFGNKTWSSIDMYFRRKGFHWNGKTFEPKEEVIIGAAEEVHANQTKAGQIVRQLQQKYTDIRQVVTKNGFSNIDDMGDYMRAQGYIWNSEENNYHYDKAMIEKQQPTPSSSIVKPEGLEEYHFLLEFLLDKKERLYELLEPDSNGTLPRYKFKGAKANKTLGLPTSLQTLLNDFSKEFNVTQRDIIEVALAEFFKRYGYEEQLNSVLQG
ncbi:hypothetical protein MHI18_10190 [Peribacillus sp. FSL H8-0477]|uniref:hypothetical protein n=1 Tax=Peribacillus sp. FSL H8-0477 TaxID=2921388 RepID=UPI0030FC8B06